MNKDLIKIITTYGTKTHPDVLALLNKKSKNNIITMLINLMTEYYNDVNSSTLREFLMVSLSGFERLEEKIGYNGYRKSSIKSNTKEYCEAKPRNINTASWKGRKLNGGGNFTDYSWRKLTKHKKDNPIMLVGGFIDGRLIYIFNFSFNTKILTDRIKQQLDRNFPQGDETNKFLRSASFGLKEYKQAKDLQLSVYVSKEELIQYQRYITKPLYTMLIKKAV